MDPSSHQSSSNTPPSTPPAFYRVVPAGNGSAWLKDAVHRVRGAPGTWLGIVGFLFFMLLIPGINYIVNILIPVALGGIMIGCQQESAKTPFKFDHLFAGLNTHRKPLLILSGYYALALITVNLLTYLLLLSAGIDIQELVIQMTPPQGRIMTESEALEWTTSLLETDALLYALLALLVSLALMIPVLMAVWFAPALVVFHNLSPTAAIKTSLKACNDNFRPFLIYGLAAFGYIVLFYLMVFIVTALIPFVGIILFILSFVLLFSISLASIYSTYEDIFNTNNNLSEREEFSNDTDDSMFA